MTEIERLKKKKQKIKIGNYIYIVCFILFICGAIYVIKVHNESIYKPDESLIVKYDLSKDIIPDPIQKNVKKEIIHKEINGVNVSIEKIASYDITGKVEVITEYSQSFLGSKLSLNPDSESIIDMISPRDLTLSWGEIALNKNNKNIYCSTDIVNKRFMCYRYNEELAKKYSSEFINSHVSNNHIITLDSGLRKVLMSVKENQIVRVKGYLVYVTTDDNYRWGPSSLVRTDSGNHACEIILAEEIVIMPK